MSKSQAAREQDSESVGGEPIRLFLTSGSRLINETLTRTLSQQANLKLVGSEANAEAVLREIQASSIDVVLVESSCDKRDALRLIERLRDRFPDLELLPIGLESDTDVIRFAEAGARGYVRRGASIPELVRTVRSVHSKQTLCSPRIAASLFVRLHELASHASKSKVQTTPHLTPREAEILRLLAEGLQNKEIAKLLTVKLSTIKNHVHQILAKLEVKNRRAAVAIAVKRGLLRSPLPPPARR